MLSNDLLHVNTSDGAALSSTLCHQLTLLCCKAPSHLAGQTVWSTLATSAVLCWKWAITSDGIAVLTDPRDIRSNLVFFEDGWALPLERQLIAINEIVNVLPWQRSVAEHLEHLGYAGQKKAPESGALRRSTSRPRGARVAGLVPAIPLSA